MKRVPLWVIALSFPGLMLSLPACDRPDAALVPETLPVAEQTNEVQDTLGNQAQQTLEVMMRDNEHQQATETLQLREKKEFAPYFPVDSK